MKEASEILDSGCPLCELVSGGCKRCPIVIEFDLSCHSFYLPCGRTRIFRMAYDGVRYMREKTQTIKAIVKMLFLLDFLWERVRWRAEYIKENA